MRLSFLLSLLFLVSCGLEKTELDPSDNIGKIWSIEEDDTFSSDEVSVIESICAAVSEKKEYALKFILNTDTSFKYELEETDCGEKDPNVKSEFTSTLIQESGDLKFQPTVKSAFSSFVTKDSLVIKDFCSKVSIETKRTVMKSSTANKYFFFEGKSGLCGGSKSEVCMFVETGVILGTTGKYKTRDVDGYKFSLSKNQEELGLVLKRSNSTTETCPEEDEFYKKEQFYTGRN